MKGRYLAVVLLAFLCDCGGPRQSVESVTPADVASMEVFIGFVHDSRLDDDDHFQVDAEDFSRVLALLRGGELNRERNLPPWQGLAIFKIHLQSGEEVVACIYQIGGGAGAYSVGGRMYRGGSDEAAIVTLAECKKRAESKRGD